MRLFLILPTLLKTDAMKYRRLTTEEFEQMHEEFSVFLATQGIDKEKWDDLKANQIDKAEEIMDIFSDVVFEKALEKCNYVERISETEIIAVEFGEKSARMILVKVKAEGVNLLEQDWQEVLPKLQKDDQLEFFRGKKEYNTLREQEMFGLMKQGGYMADSTLFDALDKWVNVEPLKN